MANKKHHVDVLLKKSSFSRYFSLILNDHKDDITTVIIRVGDDVSQHFLFPSRTSNSDASISTTRETAVVETVTAVAIHDHETPNLIIDLNRWRQEVKFDFELVGFWAENDIRIARWTDISAGNPATQEKIFRHPSKKHLYGQVIEIYRAPQFSCWNRIKLNILWKILQELTTIRSTY